MAETITADLVQCPLCKAPAIIVNGSILGEVTVFGRQLRTCFTPHAPDCKYRGKATPHPEEVRRDEIERQSDEAAQGG